MSAFLIGVNDVKNSAADPLTRTIWWNASSTSYGRVWIRQEALCDFREFRLNILCLHAIP